MSPRIPPVARRVVEVYRSRDGRHRIASGHLLDDRLVLTAGHAVDGAATVGVRLLDGGSVWGCSVVWWRYDSVAGTGIDAALLRIDDDAFREPEGLPPLVWGRLGTGSRCPVEAVGFPAGMRVREEGAPAFRDTAHITGSIAPGSRLKAGRHEIKVDNPVPAVVRAAHTGQGIENVSRWSGMSGAAVTSGGLVLGLVAVDPDRGGPGGALTAVPSASLLADERVAELLGRPRAYDVGLPSVLQTPPSPARSPVGLLRAEVSPVGFHGREPLMEEFVRWCLDPSPWSPKLLTGPGGQGKTRLAVQLVDRMAGLNWNAGFLDFAPDTDLAALAELSAPLLLVVDYAETRHEQLIELLRLFGTSAARGTGPPVRLLMLARSAGEWWQDLRRKSRALREPPPGTVAELGPLADDPATRPEAFRHAVEGLAHALARLPGLPATPRGFRPESVVPPPLSDARFARALELHSTALAALLQHLFPVPDASRTQGMDLLMRHEEAYWTRTTSAHQIERLHTQTLRQLVVTATLCRARTLDEAGRLLERSGILRGETANTVLGAAMWLNELYGGRDGHWVGLVPDLLGEHLVGTTARDFPELLPALAELPDAEHAGHLLRVLCRTGRSFPELDERIVHLVVGRPRPLAPAAVDVLAREGYDALGRAVDAVLDGPHGRGPLCAELLAAVPRHTVVLAGRAVRMAEQVVAHARAATDAPRELASALHALAYRLARAGRYAEALQACEEGIRVRGGDTLGAAADPEFMDALLGYGARLDEVGRTREAVDVGERLLAALGPGHPSDTPEAQGRRATVLHQQALWLHRAGRHDEALALGAACVRARKRLLRRDPRWPAVEMADARLQLALYLQHDGRTTEAAEETARAVAILRGLAEDHPDAYLRRLAEALHNQARLSAVLRDHEAALDLAEEAVAIQRGLLDDAPTPAQLALLARLLGGLSVRLTSVRRLSDALEVAEESVRLRRELAEGRDPRAVGELACALADLALALRRTGDDEAAVAASEESVLALRDSTARGGTSADDERARILCVHGLALGSRDPARAVKVLEEAADAARTGRHAMLLRRCLTEIDKLRARS
ncbi:tetratricopeptide repeat protein [Streptomyces sp. 11x1]|uniref:tetratricopeptide repeat protein n=1 Tax=Streptomyces sp. 11x1 TaxID=3038642 RepID=UPI00292FB87E|nr:tetratricopeptide repeat protein [Streptomyces sp. 11x1]WNZ14249.1 tetratricopeptide repeat protein [Streptomyces sp. 11x1]